jgi:competence protein ComEC
MRLGSASEVVCALSMAVAICTTASLVIAAPQPITRYYSDSTRLNGMCTDRVNCELSMLVGTIWLFLRGNGTGRRLPVWLLAVVLAMLAFYTLFTGATPSVVRAAIMSAILLMAPLVGRRYDPIAALAVSSILITLFEPNVLAEPGFQLSFAPMLGIGLISPRLTTLLQGWRIPSFLAAPLSAGIGAQLATFPLIALLSGQVSLVSPFATLFVDLALLPLMVAGIATALIGALIEPLANITGLIVWACGAWMVWWVRLWATVPWASVSVEGIGAWWVAPYYVLIGLSLWLSSARIQLVRWRSIVDNKSTVALAAVATSLWAILIAVLLLR